ncbi:MAG TPA: OmpA family protein [Kofleriaceae bacterium]|nr:OmpA family protein [Kofleriaceae bacterium]
MRRLLPALAAAVAAALAGCPARQVGPLEGPGVLEDPTATTAATKPAAPDEPPPPADPTKTPAPGPAAPTTPPTDRDGDGFADATDACPDAPEIMNGYQDDDGCPDDPPRIIVNPDPAPPPPIEFAAGSAALSPATHPALDSIVATLEGHPEIELVELQGYTDGKERGAKLDVARAEAARRYLVAHGVDAARLSVKGYGATQPVAAGTSDEARARNRRIAFSIKLRLDAPDAAP